jgi:tRNA 2-thiouridine synthesizing protein B
MALLHTMNKSPFERNAFEACLTHVKTGSTVLLLEDGIYAAVKGTPAAKKLGEAMKSVKVYVLGPDVEARGMNGRLIDGVQSVDYGGFVDLVTQHNAVESWL